MSHTENPAVILRSAGLFALLFVLPSLALCQRAEAPALAYKLAEQWPMPSTSAAGAPGPWNFGQVSAVAITVTCERRICERASGELLARGEVLDRVGQKGVGPR